VGSGGPTGREQRTVFGEAADLYDRARAGYPDALVDDVVAHCPTTPRRALEVGAGTGKATVAFATRGFQIVALEPSAPMARVLVRNCVRFPGVVIRTIALEDWPLEEEAFGLVFSAQAWHWVDPEIRYKKAARALVPGGTLALFWHRPDWAGEALREELESLYQRVAPELRARNPAFPGFDPLIVDELYDADVADSGLFGNVERRLYRWKGRFTSESFTELLSTQSDHRLYPDAGRTRLFDAVRELIRAHGDEVVVPHATLLVLARSLGP
jgi:SAM-dependent methyltransferase